MKTLNLATLLLGLLLYSCNQTENQSTSSTTQPSTSIADNQQALQQLVKQMYEWHETKSSQNDFEPVADSQDSAYVSLDMKKHELRLNELKQSNFFSADFLDNYNKIATTIDAGLKTKKLVWYVGELPPFGNDANPWCNCQDYPENYWQTMAIGNVKVENSTASFTWTWGDNFEYPMKAIKENDTWKIAYMKGFDFEEFVPK